MTRAAELHLVLAEHHAGLAAAHRELAEIEQRAEQKAIPSGWISQRESPIGKAKHLALWRRLRDAQAEGIKASGKDRLVRADVFAAQLADAVDAPRLSRTRVEELARARESRLKPTDDLRAALGLEAR